MKDKNQKNINTERKLRVLQVPSWYIPKGGQFCLVQSLALKEKGIDVHILANVTLGWRKYGYNIMKYPSLKKINDENGIITARYFMRGYPSFLNKQSPQNWIDKTIQLYEFYQKKYGAPDVIHVHSCCFAGSAARIIHEKYNIPYIITEHWSAFSGKSELAKQLLMQQERHIKYGYEKASYVLAVSKEIIPYIKKFFTNDIPIHALSNIVDNQFFTPPKERKTNEIFTFFSANDFLYHKGFDILLAAANILIKQGYDFRIKIAGKGFETTDFKKLIKLNHCEKIITLLGYLNPEDIRYNLQTSDAFVIPSRNESQSIAVLEALATGLPIVCTELIPEEFVDDKTGYRVPIENPELLADAMKNMMQNRNKFNENILIERVKNLASADYVSSQLINVYNKVLSSNFKA